MTSSGAYLLQDDSRQDAGASRSSELAATTLLEILRGTAGRAGERLALDADEALTYAQLLRRADELAARLSELGVGRGDRVGVRVSSGSAELYVAILGVLAAGAAYVPIDAEDPEARAAELLARADACAVVRDSLEIESLGQAYGAAGAPGPDDDAWVIFTSGSTGRPKAVAVTHRAAAAFVKAEAELFTIDPDDRVLAGLSVSFDASCEEMWLAWRHGATLVPAPRALVRSGVELGRWLAQRAITVVSTVPTLAALWDEGDLDRVRLLILGGEACPEPLGWRLAERREVWNTYGPTEATVVSTAARIEPGRPITIGWPLSGWDVAVLDPAGEVVPVGEPGELVIGGTGLGRYLDPELDRERFAPVPALGWERAYRTGDIVRSTFEGIYFMGRRDDQVKVGGRRIELGEIDGQLAAVPGVRAAATAVRSTEAGNQILVAYVVSDVDPSSIRAQVAERLPAGMVPLIVALERLPRGRSGKVDRKALPWPPPAPVAASGLEAGTTAAWLAERWGEQLGPLPITPQSDFFALGGSSLAAARLVSILRTRFPAVAVADVYKHRRLDQLADHLDGLAPMQGEARPAEEEEPRPLVQAAARPEEEARTRGWGLLQLAGVLILFAVSSAPWLLGILTFARLAGAGAGPQLAWGWLILGWVVFGTAAGKAGILTLARRILLPTHHPGCYPRHGWLMWRLWFLERLAEAMRPERMAGTPFAARYARLSGHKVGRGARLGTLPPVTSLISIGAGATLEDNLDLRGWWVEGDELIVGEVAIGAGARVGTRTVLAPGAKIGAGAEIEPGSVVSGHVPPGERWAGSPARRVGVAGEHWPAVRPPRDARARFWKAMFMAGLAWQSLLALLASAPLIVALVLMRADRSAGHLVLTLLIGAPAIAASFIVSYAVLVALTVRFTDRLIRPGWHSDDGACGWALWLGGAMMDGARDVLFPVCSSLYMRPWLRLAGIEVGRGAELCTVVGLNRLTSFAGKSFATDDVLLSVGRARDGWLRVDPIEVGGGTFLGNGAIVEGDTRLGRDSLVGVLTISPRRSADGTSWFGSPAIELPRVPDAVDPARSTDPPRRLVAARAAMELIRILAPASISSALATLTFGVAEAIAQRAGLAAMAMAMPLVLIGVGVCATLITIAAKWLIIGRYRPGEHPLWSFFVWRDEILNSLQSSLAGTWLLGAALGTPVIPVYLRAMGAKVGRNVWCEDLSITEFDVVELGDGCVINRFACVETHLFHDRLMRIGPASMGAGSTLGAASAMLPDSTLGAGCTVGARSVVMRGEHLPAGTRWHGSPVAAA